MRHFYRSHLVPARRPRRRRPVLSDIGLASTATAAAVAHLFRPARRAARSTSRPKGGHYTFVEVDTDQMGESRLDRNVKRFFVSLHREEDPRHVLEAAY